MRGQHPSSRTQSSCRCGGKGARRFPQFHGEPRFSEAIPPGIFCEQRPAPRAEGSSASRRIYGVDSRRCQVAMAGSGHGPTSRGSPKIHHLLARFAALGSDHGRRVQNISSKAGSVQPRGSTSRLWRKVPPRPSRRRQRSPHKNSASAPICSVVTHRRVRPWDLRTFSLYIRRCADPLSASADTPVAAAFCAGHQGRSRDRSGAFTSESHFLSNTCFASCWSR